MRHPSLFRSILRLLFSWRLFLGFGAGMMAVFLVERAAPGVAGSLPLMVVVLTTGLAFGWRWHRTADFV